MNADRVLEIDVGNEIDRLFDDSSLSNGAKPRAIIYSHGFVLIDAAEMFHHLSGEAFLEFPDDLLEPLELIGPLVAQRAISEQRHIVTEIIGAEPEPAVELIEALKKAGYYIEAVGVTCDLEESMRRNQERGDNISAYYAEPFQRRWLIDACAQFAP